MDSNQTLLLKNSIDNDVTITLRAFSSNHVSTRLPNCDKPSEFVVFGERANLSSKEFKEVIGMRNAISVGTPGPDIRQILNCGGQI